MKLLLLLSPLIALLPISCANPYATREGRISGNPQLYSSLNDRERQLVDAGQIENGMSKGSVWLSWGEPAGKNYGQVGKANTEQWIYRTYRPVYTQSFYGSSYGYGPYHGRYGRCGYGYDSLGFGMGVNYIPVPSAKVDFENDRVVAWTRGSQR